MRDIASFATSDARWDAVVEGNTQADGAFVYAVQTTGVYCRPSCASRRPKRENVTFFDEAAAAEAAGFRACKRCQPQAAASPQVEAVTRACALIEEMETMPHLRDLADAVGMSQYHFHRLFTKTVGVTPRQYAHTTRMRRLQERLGRDASVTTALYNAGFESSSSFYAHAGTLGMAPAAYRKGAPGEQIRFGMAPCVLGWVLVAATARGICAIDLADVPEVLRERLGERFAQADLSEDPEVATWVADVVAFIAQPARGCDLPLDIQGTAFQQRVWAALRTIPAGATSTYAAVAAQIGQPTAARAVAAACAANTLAVAVPCHRVVRSDGELSGYRWGIERKRALLTRESGASPDDA